MANILHPFHGIGFIHLYFFLLLLSYTFAQGNNNNNNGSGPPNPYGLDASFNPSMAIIIIVLITAFFFMGFFSIYIRHCAGARRTDTSMRATNANTGRSRRVQRGLDPTVIETFPTFLYSIVKGLKIGKGSLECAVCLNEFEDDEILRLLPKCDHVFHPECIDAWLASHTTCPVCRANLAVVADSAATATLVAAESANSLSESASESESDHENIRPPQAESVHGEVCINVSADPQQTSPEVINPTLLPAQNRPVRNKSTRKKISGKFPRSHSTGHSLVQPGENFDRFTLRLPDEVRKQIMLSRTTSCVAFPQGDRSFSRRSSGRGYRGSDTGSGPDGSSRGSKHYQFWRLDQRVDQERAKSDRWVFSMAPPFLSRGASLKSTKGGVDGEGSMNSRTFLTSVKTPFDCLSAKEVVTKEQSSSTESRPPV